MDVTDFSLRLLCAMCSGLLIGFERQWHHKSAGIRTNTLVATGAALYVLLSLMVSANHSDADVTRIIGQVVSGIGFLGAGIIFKDGINVHGLTTAATVWCSSAIGCMAGAGYYWHTLIGTIAILVVNLLFVPIDHFVSKRH